MRRDLDAARHGIGLGVQDGSRHLFDPISRHPNIIIGGKKHVAPSVRQAGVVGEGFSPARAEDELDGDIFNPGALDDMGGFLSINAVFYHQQFSG